MRLATGRCLRPTLFECPSRVFWENARGRSPPGLERCANMVRKGSTVLISVNVEFDGH